jgi:hypothetical protein
MRTMNATRLSVIPAKAGTQSPIRVIYSDFLNDEERSVWGPAFAGMTAGGGRRYVS